MAKNKFLELAVEILKALPAGAKYVNSSTPSDAKRQDTETEGSDAQYWFPSKYNEDKEKANETKPEPEKATIVRSKNKLSDYANDMGEEAYETFVSDDLYSTSVSLKSYLDHQKVDAGIVTGFSDKDKYTVMFLSRGREGELQFNLLLGGINKRNGRNLGGELFDSVDDAKIAISRFEKVGFNSIPSEQRKAMKEDYEKYQVDSDYNESNYLRLEWGNYDTLFEKQRKITTVMLQDIKSNSFDREKYMEAFKKIMWSTIKRSDEWKEEAEDREELEETGLTGTGENEEEYYGYKEKLAEEAARGEIKEFLVDVYVNGSYTDALINPKYDKGFTLNKDYVPQIK
tara:strand:- start:78 stop:1106 length:1029 start_codon:yes stop_codon:yes gene_type:complete